MAKDLIRYDLMVQDALKGVVRKVLTDAARDGRLPGEHHFYVSFRTDFPGVRVSQRLRDKYPQDMTIVLQHQFWDLGVTEHAFEVGLSFSGIPERLLIPFDALTGFFDPSVQFGLKFEVQEGAEEAPAAPRPQASAPVPVPVTRHARGAASEPTEATPKKPVVPAKSAAPKLAPKPPAAAAVKRGADKPERPPEAEKDKGDAEHGAEVVSLDAFRKKS